MSDVENIIQAILNPGMKPTVKLRWAINVKNVEGVHGYCAERKLQQYWQDGTGAGEWRDVKEEG